jgi:hypothetical protein
MGAEQQIITYCELDEVKATSNNELYFCIDLGITFFKSAMYPTQLR